MSLVSLSTSARREILVRASNLESVLEWVCSLQEHTAANASLRESAERQIAEARSLAQQGNGQWRATRAGDLECADLYLDAAYVSILRLAPAWYVDSLLTNLLMHAQQHLSADDLRLQLLEDLQGRSAQEGDGFSFEERDRNVVIATLQASQEAARHEVGRVRNLRSVIIGVAAATMLLAVGIGLFSAWQPGALPMCFSPESNTVVCPLNDRLVAADAESPAPFQVRNTASGLDAALILGVGLLGAAIAAATGLRQMTAGHDPYSLQVTLAIAKLPIGAVTAFLGVLLLRAEFVPGLSALDSSAQIIGWAIVLGYAQQLFTGFVDKKAASLLEQVASAPEPARTPATVPARRVTVAARPT
jgi:hypothetical protein